jgi:cyclic pyranopterin phosphate synthase
VEDRFGHYISYLRVSITDRCNERCAYCMPGELHEWLVREHVLTFEETWRLIRIASELGVSKIRITGGEPLTRREVVTLVRGIALIPGIHDLGLSTNGTLLPKFARDLRKAGVKSVNISLDTLDRQSYARITGRDYLPLVLEGIDAAIEADFEQIKLNCVLMRGRNDEQLVPLIEFAGKRNLILRFIELMPVTTTEVLSDENFVSIQHARRAIEKTFGGLIAEPTFKTNGPATYYQIAGRDQRIGFIGALTNLHFCETCNKLRLTCDGKLRPCLGSHLEFDVLRPLRAGASDEELRAFFLEVVARKPERHEFRDNYQPQRRMIAIGG